MRRPSVALSLQRQKGRLSTYTFSQLPHHITDSKEYARLTARAVKLLVDLLAQYRGTNNGDLSTAPGTDSCPGMRSRGWRSHSNLQSAIAELLDAGFVVQTRLGGRHRPALFALTWLPIHECGGKLEVRPSRGPLNLWKDQHKNEREAHRLVARQCAPGAKLAPSMGNCSPPVGQSEAPVELQHPTDGAVEATKGSSVSHGRGAS